MSKTYLNLLEVAAETIYYCIQDAKKVSRLKLDKEQFLNYIHTCVVLGSLPIERNTYEETSIDEYKVIDAISCLSHFVTRVNAVTKDSLSEKDHLKQKVLNLELKQKEKVEQTQKLADESNTEVSGDTEVDNAEVEAETKVEEAETAVPFMARVLSVDVFNRITTILKGALKCGETTVTRTKFTIAEMSDLPHKVDNQYFDNGKFDYAPVMLDVAIYDEYEAIDERAFLKHFKTAVVKELANCSKGGTGKTEVTQN